MRKKAKPAQRRCTSDSTRRFRLRTKKPCHRGRPSLIFGASMTLDATPGGLALNLYRPLEGHAGHGRLGFKLYRSGAPIALSDSLPMLERMGVRVMSERGYQVAPESGEPLWVHDFSLQLAGSDDIDAEAVAPLFEESFARVFEGAVENDDFNRLVLLAGLSADEIVMLARLREGDAPNRVRLVADVCRDDAGNAPADRAHVGGVVQAALRSGLKGSFASSIER